MIDSHQGFLNAWRAFCRTANTRYEVIDGVDCFHFPVAFANVNVAWITDDVVNPGQTLDKIIQHYASLEVPFYLKGEGQRNVMKAASLAGLESTDPLPCMRLSPLSFAAPPTHLEIVRVGIDEWSECITTGAVKGFGWSREIADTVFVPELLDMPDSCFLVGRVEGKPVATSMVQVVDGLAGIYYVSVIPEMRRRSFATAMTNAAINFGHEVGADRAILQASTMGFGVYEKMGFEVEVMVESYLGPVLCPK